MRDFKSYTPGRKKTGRNLLKLIFLVTLPLGAIALYLFLYEHSPEGQAPQPDEATKKPSSQEPGRITVPLLLPGQNQEEGRILPEASDAHTSKKITRRNSTTDTADGQPDSLTDNKAAAESRHTDRVSHRIVKGDTLSSIFETLGLSANLLHRIVNSSKVSGKLANIKPGETLHVELENEGKLTSLILEQDKIHSLHINATESGFTSSEQTKDVELRNSHIQGTIDNSLYLSAKEAGLPDAIIMELANIFGWDIDFALEIRSGDYFTVIYQEEYLNGEKLRNGPILAAEFVNQGRSYRAVRYEDATGKTDYFTPEGRSMRKAFLRAPVDFRRISSRFSKERWHPVLGKKRPHRGVDYAASTGTPIKAAGDGKIIHRGTKGGYGRTVIVQHGQGYTTLYGHLSRYNKKVKKGSKVKQGQVIGYVGQSGLATGPHLHYEFRVNGAHRNPLTVKLPAAKPIAKKYHADFIMQTQALTAQLDTLNRIVVADAR